MQPIGIYLHLPFCRKKCPYCDFYSLSVSESIQRDYVTLLTQQIQQWHLEQAVQADTLYLGGGTPTVLPASWLCELVSACRERFQLDGEVTIEANPSTVTLDQLQTLREGGFNRISFGMQSAVAKEQQMLERDHSTEQVWQAVTWAKQAGFSNLSVDMMLGTPYQTMQSVKETLSVINELNIQHVSAYLLKIEPETTWDQPNIKTLLPEEDLVCDLYLYVVQQLGQLGLQQYEISNFALPGYESRHNLKYWNREYYLGFGPSAHSFFADRRFYYDRDLSEYLKTQGQLCIQDPTDQPAWSEYLMLRMRLTEGVPFEQFQQLGGNVEQLLQKSRKYMCAGLMKQTQTSLSCAPEGFLISNAIISDLM